MADYEKECFMVQGFSSSSNTSNPHSEFVQDAQQGIYFLKICNVELYSNVTNWKSSINHGLLHFVHIEPP